MNKEGLSPILTPFAERASAHAARNTKAIFGERMVFLSPEEEQLAFEFAHSLFAGKMSDHMCAFLRTIEDKTPNLEDEVTDSVALVSKVFKERFLNNL